MLNFGNSNPTLETKEDSKAQKKLKFFYPSQSFTSKAGCVSKKIKLFFFFFLLLQGDVCCLKNGKNKRFGMKENDSMVLMVPKQMQDLADFIPHLATLWKMEPIILYF